jgi:hypothetical protein
MFGRSVEREGDEKQSAGKHNWCTFRRGASYLLNCRSRSRNLINVNMRWISRYGSNKLEFYEHYEVWIIDRDPEVR